MRLLPLVGLALALAACGAREQSSGGCAAAIVYDDAVYFGVGDVRGVPPPGEPAGEAELPGCNDGGGSEDGEPVDVREVRGVPRAVALYAAGDLYVDPGYPTGLPQHPLHEQLAGRPAPRRRRGRPCRLDAEVVMTQPLWVSERGRRVSVAIDRRTRIEGFQRGGLPYLAIGDRLRILARACRGDGMVARRIEPRP